MEFAKDKRTKMQKRLRRSRAISAGILAFGLIFVPLFLHETQLLAADLEESAFEQSVVDRIDSVKKSFSGLVIEDPNLLQCIKKTALEKANTSPMDTGGIDAFDQLPMLMCMDENITSIRGISSLQELTSLNLDYNAIEDIFELQNLPALQALSLVGNPVKNISTLLQIDSLRKVTLPDLPEVYCFEIETAVANVQSNVERIRCRGKWSPQIKALSDKKMYGRPLTSEEENLLYDYQFNQNFMPVRK